MSASEDELDLNDDLLGTYCIRSSMQNQYVGISSVRESMCNQYRRYKQTDNITQCLVNYVFQDQEAFVPLDNEPCETLPFVKATEYMPSILRNTLFFRFKDNKLVQSGIRCDIHHLEYEIYHNQSFCAAPLLNEPFVLYNRDTYKKMLKYSVRVVLYQKQEAKSRRLSRYELENGLYPFPNQQPIKVVAEDEPIIILHDFHQHPMLLKQLASELGQRTVYIPSMHDLLAVSSLMDQDHPLASAADILRNIFSKIAKVAVIGHGVGCIVAQQFCNQRSYSMIIMCNPPPRFRYIFEKEQVVKMSRFIEVNTSFTGTSETPVPREEETYKEQIQCNTVKKQYCITPNGNRQHVCGDYDEGIKIQCQLIYQQQWINADHDYFSVCNDFLYTEYPYLKAKFKQFRILPRFHSQMNLEHSILQASRAGQFKFRELLLNLLVFAPFSAIFSNFDSFILFNKEFFAALPIFAQLLCDEMPVIPSDTRQKYVLFGSNYAFAEVQTMAFFKQVDKNDGDFYCKTIVGCGYDMFQCTPRVISHLIFNLSK